MRDEPGNVWSNVRIVESVAFTLTGYPLPRHALLLQARGAFLYRGRSTFSGHDACLSFSNYWPPISTCGGFFPLRYVL
jgi:hypothetical protein